MKIGNFEITADKHNFILTETYEGKDRQGNPKTQVSEQRYYGRIEDALQSIIQRTAMDSLYGDVDTLLSALGLIHTGIVMALEQQNIPVRGGGLVVHDYKEFMAKDFSKPQIGIARGGSDES